VLSREDDVNYIVLSDGGMKRLKKRGEEKKGGLRSSMLATER